VVAGEAELMMKAGMASGAGKAGRGTLVLVLLACFALPASPAQPASPARIVSLVPALTEILFAVGAGRQVVGVSSFDNFSAEVRSLPRVGGLIDPDTERILSLRPDLVLIHGSQTDLVGEFQRAGIRVYSYRYPTTGAIAEIEHTIRELGSITGHAAQGENAARDLQSRLDAVRARVRGRPRPKTMIVIGRDALALRGVFVSGGIGFLHEMLEAAGGGDVFDDQKRESVQPSNEVLLTRAPDVIVELHAGDPPAADVLQKERAVWSQLPSIPAVRNGRVYLLYGGYLVSPGPRLGEAAEQLARVLHPEAYR
jgi:iron complex transport system substrate-binding protein